MANRTEVTVALAFSGVSNKVGVNIMRFEGDLRGSRSSNEDDWAILIALTVFPISVSPKA
jgi:hypothetical protein